MAYNFFTTAHLYKMSEETKRSVFDIVWEGGATGYDQEAINELARLFTDDQVQRIIDRLMAGSQLENNRMLAAQKDKDAHWQNFYETSCRGLAHCAALWVLGVNNKDEAQNG